MNKKQLNKGIALMLLSAASASVGQLFWKLAAGGSVVLLIIGFVLYGLGAILMVLALRYGELSVLHPMMSAGYVLSLILGSLVLGETLSWTKVTGVAVIIAGLVLLGSSEKRADK